MSLNLVSSFNGVTDPDAGAYIAAVEQADGQLLEYAVGKAINDFIVGCKNDAIWDAIKASCILAGARTLTGALIPLKGTAPTNFNFVSGDYNRKTGLVGNGSTKYLDSNRSSNADPQNNSHISIYVSTGDSTASGFPYYMGGGSSLKAIARSASNNNLFAYISANSGAIQVAGQGNTSGFKGATRSLSTSITMRSGGVSTTSAQDSSNITLGPQQIVIFARNFTGTVELFSNPRLAFYSIGESIDLALLDTRITTLINAISAAIP